MPVYYYKCDICLEDFSFQHSSKDEMEECPSCKEPSLTKIPPPIFIKKIKDDMDQHREELSSLSYEELRERAESHIEENKRILEEMNNERLEFDPLNK